jgi:hypothetical protein
MSHFASGVVAFAAALTGPGPRALLPVHGIDRKTTVQAAFEDEVGAWRRAHMIVRLPDLAVLTEETSRVVHPRRIFRLTQRLRDI